MAQLFNACEYLLDRRLAAGDGQRIALTGPAGEFSYAQLHDRVCRTAPGALDRKMCSISVIPMPSMMSMPKYEVHRV